MTQEELYVADARQFKESIKSQFLAFRSKFRSVVDEVRTTNYDRFAKLGLEKESARVAKEGPSKSGTNVYS